METLAGRVALLLTLVGCSLICAPVSIAALLPVASTTYAGSYYDAGPFDDRTLPADLLSAHGLALHPFTNDDINNSLAAINPNIFIAGIDSNQFVVPTLPGSPCRLGCSLFLDIEALQSYLGPSIEIKGIAVSMFQIGSENEGWATLTQGSQSGQKFGIPFSSEDQYTLLYRGGVFDNPADLAAMMLEIGFVVGDTGLSRGLWAQAYYITASDVRAVPEPDMLGLGALAVLGLIVIRRPRYGRVPLAALVN
ncbi:MAG: hypothetical protein IPK20_15825 [Betaproteobacteria bacterium]|nr:hypothetical protein [Betaproteobacteria bacterium]